MDNRSLKAGLNILGKALSSMEDAKIEEMEAYLTENESEHGNSQEASSGILEFAEQAKPATTSSQAMSQSTLQKLNVSMMPDVTNEKLKEAMKKPDDHHLTLKGRKQEIFRGRVAYSMPVYLDKVRGKM